MSVLEDLRVRRNTVFEQAKALAQQSATENRAMNSAEEAEWTSLYGDLDKLDERIREVEATEQRSHSTEAAFAAIRGKPEARENARLLPTITEYRRMLSGAETEYRAVGSAGNAFVPTAQSDQWYDRLRNAAAVLRAVGDLAPGNVLTVEDNFGGVLNVPRVGASATAAMVAENTAITPSDPTTAATTLTPRKAAVMTLVANEAMTDSRPELRGVVATDLARTVGTLLDTQMVTGDGTAPNMRGLLSMTGTTAGPSQGANGAVLSADALADTIGALASVNGNLDSAALIVAPRTVNSIRKLKDTAGRYLFLGDSFGQAGQGFVGTVFGIPVYVSGNVPINLTVGTSTDCTTLILADMTQVLIGRRREIEVAYSTDYAFNADQTAIRCIARFDIQPIDAAGVVLTPGIRP